MVTVFRDIPISNNPVDYISVIKMLIYSSTKMKRFFFSGRCCIKTLFCEYVVSEDGLLRLYLFNQDTTYSASKMKHLHLVYVVGCLFKFVPLFARDFMACFM